MNTNQTAINQWADITLESTRISQELAIQIMVKLQTFI